MIASNTAVVVLCSSAVRWYSLVPRGRETVLCGWATTDTWDEASPDAVVGKVVGPFAIVGRLGDGSVGGRLPGGARCQPPRRRHPRAGRATRLGDKLGTGGMAEVFLGTMVGAEGFVRRVAIKRVPVGAIPGPGVRRDVHRRGRSSRRSSRTPTSSRCSTSAATARAGCSWSWSTSRAGDLATPARRRGGSRRRSRSSSSSSLLRGPGLCARSAGCVGRDPPA